MVEKKPIFCSLAFGSASINSYGEYIPCCSIRTSHWKSCKDTDPNTLTLDPKDRINAENLRQVRRELMEGNWPSVCENCKLTEAAGVNSMRTIWNRGLEDYDIPMKEYVDPNDIKYLDLTFSTKCNSKCMTCSPDLSDFWEDEHKFIWGGTGFNQDRICIKESTAKKLVDQFRNIVRVNFVGGEPTISAEHIEFLNVLIDSGTSKDITLGYVTNLTGMNTELISMWNNFKEIGSSVSIDGYDKVNEYIRYPIKWDKTDLNLRRYLQLAADKPNQYMFGLSCTVSLFNAIQCVDLLEYWIDITNEYKLNTSSGIFLNRVSHPEFLTVNHLSPEYRQKGIDKANKLLKKIKAYDDANEVKVNDSSRESVELLISWLSEPQIHDRGKLVMAKHFITQSDKFRKRHLKDYIPDLWEELEKLWQNL